MSKPFTFGTLGYTLVLIFLHFYLSNILSAGLLLRVFLDCGTATVTSVNNLSPSTAVFW